MVKEIAILGGNGMLGSDLADLAGSKGVAVKAYDLPDFDMTNESQLEEVVSKSKVVVNCAAYTNVEKAETDIELANQINGYAVGKLGEFCKKYNVPIIHISTDFVFDGQKEGAYVETDQPNPLSVYGSSKLLGEKLLFESDCQCCVLRVQWTYGKNGVNFITKVLAASEKLDQLKIVDDQIGCPTHTYEVGKVIFDLLDMEILPCGLYHVAARGSVSRYEMTNFIFNHLGIDIRVVPCKSSDFKTAAQRPLNSRFDCGKIEKTISRNLPEWQEMLKKYLETL